MANIRTLGRPADVLPPDQADWARCTPALQEFLRALSGPWRSDLPDIRIELDPISWKAIRNQFKRPYRAEPREFTIALQEGMVNITKAPEPLDATGHRPDASSACDSCRALAETPKEPPHPDSAEGRQVWLDGITPSRLALPTATPLPDAGEASSTRPEDAIWTGPTNSDDSSSYGKWKPNP